MVITKEINLENFEAWSGGEDTLDRIIENNACDTLEATLVDAYPDGIGETELNDILRFESDWCYEMAGLKTYSEIEDDIDEIKDNMADLKSDFEYDVEQNDIKDTEEYWNENYADDYNDLAEQLDELEEELETF